MATIRPFRAIRPVADKAAQVAALPYDVLNSEEAREVAKGNPYSFLHVDKAEIDLDPAVSPYDNRVYEKANENLQRLINEEVLIQDEEPCFYIYQLTMQGRTQSGIVVCTSIDEYTDNTIKKHERTRHEKEQDRIRHVDVCNANTGPIFLTYRTKETITKLIVNWQENHAPIYQFTADDGVEHVIWKIAESDVVSALVESFEEIPSLYIADGHHRSASAVKVGLMRREQYPNYTGEEEFNFFLSVLFPHDELSIWDYNRVVKDLNGLSEEQFLQQISQYFYVEKAGVSPYKPTEPKSFCMYLDHLWYKLTVKKETFDVHDVVKRLDVSILQDHLLSQVLQIHDPRADARIDFVGGIRGLEELERLVNRGDYKVAFALYPTSMEDLLMIADAGEVMPPKSTWFEPKLRSGLIIHSLE
ncbi:hypothetical protein CON65_11195 [Bacillus pseudomycoides]|uniref:DUF1015 domain-containing protein n=1 Tax=Bacillus pseudomycoides TaxID=64104 RepID=A0AA91VE89_9BACI|nr:MULTISPECIES: DUF1015 family protein [Bacillus]PEB47561.1 hypothetical protein COO03_25905 [Bacillus sp. AFS098217]PED82520.1 hypothetical protein CON65_11195 [Bacillus pseudomycoides]PEU11522.1 hypothetical protein CN525_21955 [Bacillus sp. AFS014408]PEU17286.1 hypothetical protein CN524_02790 [Bacillus sp. AFS019443]PFW60718.1 hypothetical protein COL20_20715 [Bacillus sp. AFS075034]